MNNFNLPGASRNRLLAAALLVLGAAGAAAWYAHNQKADNPSARTERKVLYWHDPMVPGPRFDKPGKSPFMDMDLVPVYADEQAVDASVIINPRALQNLGVRYAKAEIGAFPGQLEALGVVKADEKKIQVVQSRQGGIVEALHVHAVGEKVRRDQPLAELYSPDLLSAQEELLLAKKMQDDGKSNAPLLDSARTRLRLFGMSVQQIMQLESTGNVLRAVPLTAPFDGVVTEISVRQGMTVPAGASLMTLADLGTLWVIIDVPENQSAWLKPDLRAEARFAALPGHSFSGKIDQIYPAVNAASRTLKARIVLDNTRGELRPDMLASVTLDGQEESNVLAVPSEAVIATGKRNVVIAVQDGGRFVPVEVAVGRERDGRTEILKGLQAGQSVVASGQFLIDSESSLKAALKRFDDDSAAPAAQAAPAQPVPAPHQHHDHAHH
ncbi:MAG: efflux transporter periplasmic adaptor subunit [Paucimonas sp.]|jgi:Cu(I)/Ag(I) efflux system membrane fusion protein|nr:efflux transporter periplasmic adaptor subunit [Paucimonas sp.]